MLWLWFKTERMVDMVHVSCFPWQWSSKSTSRFLPVAATLLICTLQIKEKISWQLKKEKRFYCRRNLQTGANLSRVLNTSGSQRLLVAAVLGAGILAPPVPVQHWTMLGLNDFAISNEHQWHQKAGNMQCQFCTWWWAWCYIEVAVAYTNINFNQKAYESLVVSLPTFYWWLLN